MTALPVLVLGLARGLTLARRSAAIAFLAAFSLAVSIEGVLETLMLPEHGYEGKNLGNRSINHYYPLHQHFFPGDQEEMPLQDIAFWALLLAALSFRPVPWHGQVRAGPLGTDRRCRFCALSVEPGRSGGRPFAGNLVALHDSSFKIGDGFDTRNGVPGIQYLRSPTIFFAEAAQPDGSLLAMPGVTSAGMVSFSRIPKFTGAPFGTCQLTLPGLRVEPPEGQVSGHIVLSRGFTFPAVSYWGNRTSYPLIGGDVGENQVDPVQDR